MSTMPAYYTEMIEHALQKTAAKQNDQLLNFIFITDPHHTLGGNQLYAAQAIQRLAETLPLDFIVCGGDLSINGGKDAVVAAQKEILGCLGGTPVPLLTVNGNHDDNSIIDCMNKSNSTENVIFPSELYEYGFRQLEGRATFDTGNEFGLYYYMDIPSKRTRVIVLNCIDIPYVTTPEGALTYHGQWDYLFSNRQLNWVANKALDFSSMPDREQWHVLIFSHVSLVLDDVYGSDIGVTNGEAMWDLIRAFHDGVPYTSASTGGNEDFAYDIAVDFTEQGSMKVIASMFGHVHYDQSIERDGMKMISTNNAYTHKEFEISPERIEGTASETVFDIITVDLASSEMVLVRVGAGEDRIIHF